MLSVFIIKLNSIQTSVWPVLYVYQNVTGSLAHKLSSPIIETFNNTANGSTVQLLYAKNVKGFLSCEIICVEHDTLIFLRVSHVFQNTHLEKSFSTPTVKQYRIQTAQGSIQGANELVLFKKKIIQAVQQWVVLPVGRVRKKHSFPSVEINRKICEN